MKITLKNVHYSSRLSTDSNCFDAMVCIDGKPAFIATDDGHGGCIDFTPRSEKTMVQDRKSIADAEAWCKTLPALPPSPGLDIELPMDLELYVGDLMDKWIEEQDMKRKCKKHLCYRLPDQAKTEFYQMKLPYSKEMAEWVKAKYPGAEILNEKFM